MNRVLPEHWRPADGLELEENAWRAIRSPRNTLIVAGPGSGKTELLAQKACYLLQTKTCPYPKRILAISFKRDAAYNLKERVKRRCGNTLSQRFDSYTFDAFAKQLLDRFRNGLPAPYDLARNYGIMARPKDEISYTFRALNPTFYYSQDQEYLVRFLTSVQLPHNTSTSDGKLLQDVWLALTESRSPKVNFQMIMRLAEFIINTNPIIKSYLQQTYSHVFLDEFQDTTFLQYDFLKSCFGGSEVNYTAVGDDKQTIMGWAGAMPDIFNTYIHNVNAERLPLRMNFRSAPKLVSFQNFLIKELLGKSDFAIPSSQWKPGQGEAFMCFFRQQSQEMQYLLRNVQSWLHSDGIKPRDICILVKLLPERYTKELINLFISNGIRARDETKLQDLLSEEVSLYMINFLQVIFSGHEGPSSDEVFSFLCNINPGYDDNSLFRLKKSYLKFCRQLQQKYENGQLGEKKIQELMSEILNFTSIDKIRLSYPQYSQGRWFRDLMLQLLDYLNTQYAISNDILTALNTLRGVDTIPVITTHKSKGLEYHTVIFVGLEDGAFFTYTKQKESDNNLVFVALSRAKERVIFTFCSNRLFSAGAQSAVNIAQIHQLFRKSPDVTVLEF